ncbi:hypothetical protein CCACVL1_03835, partial [Corchorus capsularis]
LIKASFSSPNIRIFSTDPKRKGYG